MATGSGNQLSLSNFSLKSRTTTSNIECRVCEDVFTVQGDKVPRLLHCGHTLCHQCLSRLPITDSDLHCPFDRQATPIGESGVWSLKKNFALVELLERLDDERRAEAERRQVLSGNEQRTPRLDLKKEALEKEKLLSVCCDENESHTAVIYCTVCQTNLCLECSEETHSTRTLARHTRIPLSEKPKENPRCEWHPSHSVEFACMEESCQNHGLSPLMCFICKDYGRHAKHKHVLLEAEAEGVRNTINSALNHMQKFSEEISDTAVRISEVISEIKGSSASSSASSSSSNGGGESAVVGLMQGGLASSSSQELLNRPSSSISSSFSSSSSSSSIGTAAIARDKVRSYFAHLRETLECQEVAALTVIDTHVRERLCSLKQQQEDLTLVQSQIAAVSHQMEAVLREDNASVVQARAEVSILLSNLQRQQQLFTEIPSTSEQQFTDPSIPVTFTRDNRVHIGPKMEMRVVTLGLDQSGKTAILMKLKNNEFMQTIPTIGFNVETVEYKNLKFTIWDVGGQPKLRPLWKHYYLNTQAVIYVIDSGDESRLNESHDELVKLISEKELREASLLIFLNKQDSCPSVTIEDITEKFALYKLFCGRSWHIQACDAISGTGLTDGLDWLSRQLVTAIP